jgi:hypothetical protein
LLSCIACGRIGFDYLSADALNDAGAADDAGSGETFDGSFNGFIDAAPGFVNLDADYSLPVDEKVVATTSGTAADASLTWTGDGYIVVWADDRTGTREVFMQPLDGNGDPRSGEAQASSGTGAVSRPQVAIGDQQFAVTWNRGGSYQFQRVAADGTLNGTVETGAEANTLFGGNFSTFVAGDGTNFALFSIAGDDIVYRFITGAGATTVDSAVAPLTGANPGRGLAWSGTRFGFSWTESNVGKFRSHDGSNFTAAVDSSASSVDSTASVWGHNQFAVASTNTVTTNVANARLEFFNDSATSTGAVSIEGNIAVSTEGTRIAGIRVTTNGYDLVRSQSGLGQIQYYRYALNSKGAVLTGPTEILELKNKNVTIVTEGPALAAIYAFQDEIRFQRLP